MNKKDKENLVNVFDWLLKQDRNQNPHLYKKPTAREGSK
jgi:hypothetical protein